MKIIRVREGDILTPKKDPVMYWGDGIFIPRTLADQFAVMKTQNKFYTRVIDDTDINNLSVVYLESFFFDDKTNYFEFKSGDAGFYDEDY